MSVKNSIIFISPIESSFIKNDIKELQKEYEVLSFTRSWEGNKIFLSSINQFFWLLTNIRKVKIIIVSLGGYWAFLPALFGKIFNKKVLIMLHGTDSSSLVRYNYGMLRKFFLRKCCDYSYQLAFRLLPVSESLMYTENSFDIKNDKQGIKFHLPHIKTDYQVIHNGIDLNFWNTKKKNRDIQYLSVFSASQYYLKGGDLITTFAKENPAHEFHIVGLQKPKFVMPLPNVKYYGKVSQVKLNELYLRTKFYLQLSSFEGFGVSLCEAMYCGALPIVSSVNMLPEIIGSTGVVIKKKNVSSFATALQEAHRKIMQTDKADIRNHIIQNYSLRKRTATISNLIKSIINK